MEMQEKASSNISSQASWSLESRATTDFELLTWLVCRNAGSEAAKEKQSQCQREAITIRNYLIAINE